MALTHHLNNLKKLCFLATLGLIWSCADKELPEAKQRSQGVSQNAQGEQPAQPEKPPVDHEIEQTSNQQPNTPPIAHKSFQYSGWGAPVGSPKVLEALEKCNKNKFYFNRAAKNGEGDCDQTRSVPVNCGQKTAEEIGALLKLSDTVVSSLSQMLKEEYAGYVVDQCVDDLETSRYIVYLVLDDQENNAIRLQEILVPKN